ncbi:hypothetical protein PAHAL_9G068700 [Panicum hallii]|uniref:Uncharacterized protein n=1 Tax=Panicum hallii TaxID=206008 RepID=A0A2T8I0E1_9POAL|nr:hypothetical protein PAHAL_9G068700 [Panicum hallii]
MCIAHLVTGRAAPTVTPQCAVVSVVPTMCSTKCHFHGKFSCGVASRDSVKCTMKKPLA